jgi:hypothetical protein
VSSKGGEKSIYKYFMCYKISDFKRDFSELGDNDDFARFEVALEDYEDVVALVFHARIRMKVEYITLKHSRSA